MRCSGIEMPTSRNRPTVMSRASLRLSLRSGCQRWLCSRIASTIWSPTVCTGLKAAIGSCGISAISPPRMSRISAPRGGELREVDDAAVGGGTGSRRSVDAARPLDELQDRPHRDALAAAAFADDAEHLAGHDVEADAVDGAHQALVQGEGDAQVAHREQRLDVGVTASQ